MAKVKDYDEFLNEGFFAPGAMVPAQRDYSWMKPRGDYSNRNWILPNYAAYMDTKQSNASFSIGDEVCCVDPGARSYGKTGVIVAFEDNTIRWEVKNTATGIGQTAEQYRCHAAMLRKVMPAAGSTLIIKSLM